MDIDSIYGLVAGNMVAAVFFILWKLERDERQRAQKRERAILREMADLIPEEIENGEA